MVKDFKGQLAITKPEERHRQRRDRKELRAFVLALSLEINMIGWKISDWMDRQTDRRGGWWGAERSWCKSLNDGPIFCLSLRYVVLFTHRR